MIDLFITLGIGDAIWGALSTMMQPLYWAVSGMLVFAHWLWSGVLGLPQGAAWTLAIITLTIVVRTLMIPLFVKQINSSRSMQLLQPKISELQAKYGADRERLGQETMKLYKEEGVNPMASCFPLLIQMPIFLALFRVLQGASDGTVRGYWLKENPDLVASLQNSSLFGAGLADRVMPFFPIGPTQIVGALLVIGMVLVLLATQLQMMNKNMPPSAMEGPMAQQQKMMLWMFPIIYLFSAIFIPVGVLVYWFASNLWTWAQQSILIRNNPSPNTPAYIDWEERMIAKGKDPKAIMQERAEKRRAKNMRKGTATRTVRGAAEAAAAQAQETDKPKVQRQQVNRTTVRTDEDGRRIVARQQPSKRTRAQRKKK